MVYDVTIKNLQESGFYHSHYSIVEQWYIIVVKTAVNKPSEWKAYTLVRNSLVLIWFSWVPIFHWPLLSKKYGGGKESKNLPDCSIVDCVTKIGD